MHLDVNLKPGDWLVVKARKTVTAIDGTTTTVTGGVFAVVKFEGNSDVGEWMTLRKGDSGGQQVVVRTPLGSDHARGFTKAEPTFDDCFELVHRPFDVDAIARATEPQ